MMQLSEAVARRCCVEKVFLEISQNSQENTCANNNKYCRPKAQVFFCEFCELSNNTFSTEHLVTAFEP